MRQTRLLAALIGASVVALASAAGYALLGPGDTAAELRAAKAFRVLREYHRDGLVGLERDDAAQRFFVPDRVVPYGGGFTVGQLLEDVRRHIGRPAAALGRTFALEDFVRFLAERFVAGTAYEGRVRVNEAPADGHLNIVFLGGDPHGVARSFGRSVCSYTRIDALIVCNRRIFAEALRGFDDVTTNEAVVIAVFGAEVDEGFRVNFLENIDTLRLLLKQSFIVWLLGHEIGHAVRHGPTLGRLPEAPLHFDLVYDRREQEADAFATEVVLREPGLGVSFAPLLLEYVEHAFRGAYERHHREEPAVVPAENRPEKRLPVGSTRETLLLWRATRMLLQALAQDPEALSRAYYTALGDRFAMIHSLKFAEHVEFLATRLEPEARETKTGIILLGTAAAGLAAAACLLLARRAGPRRPTGGG